MGFYEDQLLEFRDLLKRRGYAVRLADATVPDNAACPVTVAFPDDILGERVLIAIPDVHISDGSAGDIFFAGDASHAERFTQTLEAINDYLEARDDVFLLQLGDWYDVWRAVGHDSTHAQYAVIENQPFYQRLIELDKELGMAHLIGNHDASFTHALPDGRVADGKLFRFGMGLMKSNGRIFSIHGHQTDDIEGVPSPDSDQRVVWLGTFAAKYLTSEARSLQNFIDQEGLNAAAVFDWLKALIGVNRPDPVPKPRPRKKAPDPYVGSFVEREDTASLVRICVDACKKRYGNPTPLELLVVGHSHKPCISWAPHPDSGKPVIVVDGGSWVHGAAQIVFGAGNRVSVFDIVKGE